MLSSGSAQEIELGVRFDTATVVKQLQAKVEVEHNSHIVNDLRGHLPDVGLMVGGAELRVRLDTSTPTSSHTTVNAQVEHHQHPHLHPYNSHFLNDLQGCLPDVGLMLGGVLRSSVARRSYRGPDATIIPAPKNEHLNSGCQATANTAHKS